MYRGYVEDAAPASLVHARQRGTYDTEGRFQHHSHDLVEFLGREILQRGNELQAGVVNHDVHVDVKCVQHLWVRKINLQRVTQYLRSSTYCCLTVYVKHSYQGAGLRQPPGNGAPNTARCTGNQ